MQAIGVVQAVIADGAALRAAAVVAAASARDAPPLWGAAVSVRRMVIAVDLARELERLAAPTVLIRTDVRTAASAALAVLRA